MKELKNNIEDVINFRLALSEDNELIQLFFSKYLSINNKAIYNGEFLCPDGLRFAIKKGNVIVAVIDKEIIGALRFYRRKRDNKISLYQFAISADYKGFGILKKMLSKLKSNEIIVKCPINLLFNDYFTKTGWSLIGQDDELNIYSMTM